MYQLNIEPLGDIYGKGISLIPADCVVYR